MAWAPDYVTIEELREYVDIDDLQDDLVLANAITAASRSVDAWCNRQFGVLAAPAARTYEARPDYMRGLWTVDIDDLQAAPTLVTVDGTTVTAPGYTLGPVNAPGKGRVWTRLTFTGDAEALPSTNPHTVAVTALWGWTSVPEPVRAATLLQANRLVKRRHAPFGVAGSPDQGSEMRLLSRLDPDVTVVLRGLARVRAVG